MNPQQAVKFKLALAGAGRRLKAALSFLAAAVLFAACATHPKKPAPPPGPQNAGTEPRFRLGAPLPVKADPGIQLYPTEFNYLPGWSQDDHAAAFKSFQHSCESWLSQPDERALGGVFALGSIGDWKLLCNIQVRGGEEKQFFEKWFRPFAVAASGGFDGLFTGYYLPELHGSRQKTARYNVPIYGVPADLIKRNGQYGRLEKGRFMPYHDRAAIRRGALAGKHAEILWVDNEVDAFFMEIQGSGRIIMDDGRVQGVGYAGKNGHAYHPIGKSLVDRGYIPREQISMQSIRAWIEKHPEEGRQLMLENRSVVFFKLAAAKAQEGPIGAMNVPLTAGHSLAVDKNYLPMGVPLWLDAEHPDGDQRIRRLLMAQDTGGAIRGVIRGDVYWGQGPQAGELAGLMKSAGRFFILIPRHIEAG
ncbi:MAG: MltA domain-containing protein [Methylococcales bacterium]|nr:MltA domain-containing protein [Methylococcales bacterium]